MNAEELVSAIAEQPRAHLNVYAPEVEPYISNSGDLTREKIA
jgi:hypothetical protein